MAKATPTDLYNLSQTEFFSEDTFTNKLTPVPVLKSVLAALVHNEESNISDLEQEFSQPFYAPFYQNEVFCYGIKRQCAGSIMYPCENVIDEQRQCAGSIMYPCKNVVDEQRYIKKEQYELDSRNFLNEDDEDHFWKMQSKIVSECVQDVRDTCMCLGICSDPSRWSCAQVQQWIAWQCRQFNLPRPEMDNFCISGMQLCSLTEEDFQMYAREAGSTLYSRFDIWRSVVEHTTNNGSVNDVIQLTQIPIPTSLSLPPSTGIVSPSYSVWGEESQPSCPPDQFEQSVRTSVTTEDGDRLPEEPVNHHRQTILLWQFLKLLLMDGNYNDCIRWVDRTRGIFKIENSTRVSKLWGKRKNRPAMNYDKLSRSIRQYYKKNIIKKTEHSKRLVYQFCRL